MALIIFVVIAAIVATVAMFVSKLAIEFWDWSRTEQDGLHAGERARKQWQTRAMLTVVILGVGGASFVFNLMRGTPLQQTSALFIGIPVLLSIATVFVPTAGSAVGVACKAVTIGLLMSLLFLGEGMMCIAMSAPIFYVVAIIMGHTADQLNKYRQSGRSRFYSSAILILLLPMTTEGVTPMTTFDRNEQVSETRVIDATPEQVAAALTASPRFDRPLPLFLSGGFPRPTLTQIDGRTWTVTMRGGETRVNGMEPREGDLVLEIDDRGPAFISWRAVSDNSHMRHFMSWQASRVEWQAIDAQRTTVTWTINYSRDLDPAWYFGPMERYAVRLAAGYLIDSVATP